MNASAPVPCKASNVASVDRLDGRTMDNGAAPCWRDELNYGRSTIPPVEYHHHS